MFLILLPVHLYSNCNRLQIILHRHELLHKRWIDELSASGPEQCFRHRRSVLIYCNHDAVQLPPPWARQQSAPCLSDSRSRSGLGVYSLHMTLTGFAAPFILSITGIGNVSLVQCLVLVFAALVLNVTRPHVRCVVGGF